MHTLALLFDVSPQTVTVYIYQGNIILWCHFYSSVTWPTIREWNEMRNTWSEFPNAVGCIDVTPHEIQVPSTEHQRKFFSGHRHFHLLNTQLICDNRGHVRFLQTGFFESMHDAHTCRLMTPVGPGKALAGLSYRRESCYWPIKATQMTSLYLLRSGKPKSEPFAITARNEEQGNLISSFLESLLK